MIKLITQYLKQLYTYFRKHITQATEQKLDYITQVTNKEYENDNDLEQHNFVVTISFTKDYNIDMVVYLNDNPDSPMTNIEYAMVCADFLQTCFTKNIQKQILKIINKEIKNSKNLQIINSLNIICEYNKTINSDIHSFIKPSQVFNYKLYNDK